MLLVGVPGHWLINSLCDLPLPPAEQRPVLDTPLHFSARYKLTKLFSYLLTLPSVLDALGTPDEQGLLPLDMARASGSVEIVHLIAE